MPRSCRYGGNQPKNCKTSVTVNNVRTKSATSADEDPLAHNYGSMNSPPAVLHDINPALFRRTIKRARFWAKGERRRLQSLGEVAHTGSPSLQDGGPFESWLQSRSVNMAARHRTTPFPKCAVSLL